MRTAEALSDAPMPFTQWWAQVQTAKDDTQWRSKLRSQGANDPSLSGMTRADIGIYLLQHLSKTGKIVADPMQDVPQD